MATDGGITISQLWLKFIDRVFFRSWLGLWNTLQSQPGASVVGGKSLQIKRKS